MCGIFGISDQGSLKKESFVRQTRSFFDLSKTRGRDSTGVAWLEDNGTLKIHRRGMSPEKFLKSKRVKNLFDATQSPRFFMGHARLVTNGPNYIIAENQPQYTSDYACVHNGIVTNDSEVWASEDSIHREHFVDTELVVKLLGKYLDEGLSPADAISTFFDRIEGTASFALVDRKKSRLILSTNNGSLYCIKNSKITYFASEKLILKRMQSQHGISGEVTQIQPGDYLVVDLSESSIARHTDTEFERMQQIRELKRCTRCILPETFPGIHFNSDGVCNFCENYEPKVLKDRSELQKYVDDIKAKDNGKCISMLSGGRDSCYQLHLICKELGINPISYTYDWGMVTDIARRNASKMCDKLKSEHIIVSADIRKKRSYIRKNLLAWIKKPHLGMLPILMAGDKEFLYYGNKIKEINGLNYTVIGACPFEKTSFKTGFTGIEEGHSNNVYSISWFKKLRLMVFYGKQILLNPRYINSSLIDSFKAFISAYVIKHKFIQIFDYFSWHEETVDRTLKEEYNWESEESFSSTWRIGDGTAAFYNYAYFILAGFTEFDTFRSNQIRAGDITRDEALALVEKNNQFRWDSLEWYAKVVGFDLSEALNCIHEEYSIYEKKGDR